MNNYEVKLVLTSVVYAENGADALKEAREALVSALKESGISMSTIIHLFRRVSVEMVK